MTDENAEWVTVTVPNRGIESQLRVLIAAGWDFEAAAKEVTEPYRPSPAAEFMWPTVRKAAHDMERKNARRIEDNAFGGTAGKRARERDRMKVQTVAFWLPDGMRVEWGTASVEQHLARIAWQETFRDAIDVDIARHRFAVQVIRDYEVSCLDDVGDWMSLPGWAATGTPDEPVAGDEEEG